MTPALDRERLSFRIVIAALFLAGILGMSFCGGIR